MAGYERVASGDSHACSHAWVRSWKCSAWTVVAMGSNCPMRSGGKFAPRETYACLSAACAAATRAIGTRYGEQLT